MSKSFLSVSYTGRLLSGDTAPDYPKTIGMWVSDDTDTSTIPQQIVAMVVNIIKNFNKQTRNQVSTVVVEINFRDNSWSESADIN